MMLSNLDVIDKASRIAKRILGADYLLENKERFGYGDYDKGTSYISVFRIHTDGLNCKLPKRYWDDQVYVYVEIRKSDGEVIDLDYQTIDGRTPDNEDASEYYLIK